MSHLSRLSSKPAVKEQLTPDVFFKRAPNQPFEVKKFWDWAAARARELGRKYPYLSATRQVVGPEQGEWKIHGSEAAVTAFKDYAVECALAVGFHGTRELAVNWWLDHNYGDHIERTPEPAPRDPKTIDYLTTHSDGTQEMHLGRYKQSGVDYRSDAETRPVDEVVKPASGVGSTK